MVESHAMSQIRNEHLKAAIQALVDASLDVIDQGLTAQQRALADQIYGLANSLGYTLDS
jgi:hypothetical protein